MSRKKRKGSAKGDGPELIIKHRAHLWLFEREVARQCRIALLAADDMARALRPPIDHDRFWYSIQGFLVGAANVSRLLWPPDERIPHRGEILRQCLGVFDGSPLKKRTLRDHFEHFDERLEEWAMESDRHGVADENIGPVTMLPGIAATDLHRHYDPATETAYFRGEAYELGAMIQALRDLGPGAAEIAAATRRGVWALRAAARRRAVAPTPIASERA